MNIDGNDMAMNPRKTKADFEKITDSTVGDIAIVFKESDQLTRENVDVGIYTDTGSGCKWQWQAASEIGDAAWVEIEKIISDQENPEQKEPTDDTNNDANQLKSINDEILLKVTPIKTRKGIPAPETDLFLQQLGMRIAYQVGEFSTANGAGKNWDTPLEGSRHPRSACCKERDPHYQGKFTYYDSRGSFDLSKKRIEGLVSASVGDTAIIFDSTKTVSNCIETARYIYAGESDDPSEDPGFGKWVWETVKWENGDWADIDTYPLELETARTVMFGQLGVKFIVNGDSFNLEIQYKEKTDTSPKPGEIDVKSIDLKGVDPHYKGKFTYYYEFNGDPELSKTFVRRASTPSIGDTAVIFDTSKGINECIEIGELIADTREPAGIRFRGMAKWVWTPVVWEHGDWADVKKCMTVPIIYPPVTIKFNVTDDKFKFDVSVNAAMSDIPNLHRSMDFMPGFLSEYTAKRRSAKDAMFAALHAKFYLKDEQKCRGKYTYYSPHVDLDVAKQIVQNFSRAVVGDTAIAFTTNRRVKEFMSIGTLVADPSGSHWEWDSSGQWKDGDWAEIENRNADWLLFEFTAVKATVQLHSNGVQRGMSIDSLSASVSNNITGKDFRCAGRGINHDRLIIDDIIPTLKPGVLDDVETSELPSYMPAFMKTALDMRQAAISAEYLGMKAVPTLADLKPYINALMDIYPIKPVLVDYPSTVKPSNSVEEFVASKAIQAYRRRLSELMAQVEYLKDTKFPYGTYIKKCKLGRLDVVMGLYTDIGKIIGWDFVNKYYRVYFDEGSPYVGCRDTAIEVWEGEVPDHVLEYKPVVDSIYVDLRTTTAPKNDEPKEEQN